MSLNLDPVTVVNAALCVIILIMGYLGYINKGDKMPLFIGIAFGLFGISHIIQLLGLGESLMNGVVAVRVLAYLIVVLSLSGAVVKK